MVSVGCLIGLTGTVAPRAILVLAWIFADSWVWIWNGDALVPLLGIIFLPYTMSMYILTWMPSGVVGFVWVWLLFGLLLDLANWGQVLRYRRAGAEYARLNYPPARPTVPSAGPSADAAHGIEDA